MYIPSYNNTGRAAWEFNTNVTASPDTFAYFPDGGLTGSDPFVNVALKGNVDYSIATYSRPTPGNWHHVVVVYDKSLPTNEVDFYIDGVLQTATRPYNSNNTNTFGNRILYLMSRSGTSMFLNGKIQHLAIYNNLSPSAIAAHSAAVFPPSTTVTLSGPSVGTIGVSSTSFTVGSNGSIAGSVIVTPNDNGAGGSFSPTSVTLTSTSTATFTYTPSSFGTKTISVTNNGGLINPSPINYTIIGSGLVSGDSTIAAYVGQNSVVSYLYTSDQLANGWTVTSIAVPGNTIDQQKTAYLATVGKELADYTIVQVGLNDLDPSEASSVTIARLQNFINTINANKKVGSVTIISTMTPTKQRLIELYGAVNGPLSYQKWLDINNAIKGLGPNPITGVGYRISNHTPLLDDGSGNLAAIYDTGDHVHENNAARQIIARVWRDSLAELGLLNPSTPSAPIIGAAATDNNSVVVNFSKPQFNGGSTITGYTVISNPAGGIDTDTGSTNLSHTITGLTYGVPYTFTVTASNIVGTSDVSSVSNSVTLIDTIDPTVSAGDDENKGAEFTQTATVSDSESGINASTYQWAKVSGPGTLTFGTSNALSTTISANTDGTYVISFTAADNAGNSSSDTFTLVWNTAPTTYTITSSAGPNGSISPSGSTVVINGDDQTFTINANPGYHITDVLVDGISAGIVTSYNFSNITESHTISAVFAIDTKTLTYIAGSNGSISGINPQIVNYGADGSTVTAVADAGYHFVNWSDNSTANPRTDTNVTGDITVTANFALDTHTLTYTAGTGGTLTGTTPQTVNYGSNGTAVNAVPNSGYHFVSWSDNSTANPRTDTNVTSDISVTANFAANASSGGGSGSTQRSVRYTCTDPKATNYDAFGRSNPALCKYSIAPTTLGGGATCPVDQTLTQNLHAPARNGKYNNYTKGIVKEAKILQAHLNRLGFSAGPVDGILGPKSDGAIKRMQTFLKTKPDGYVGPMTRALINASCK